MELNKTLFEKNERNHLRNLVVIQDQYYRKSQEDVSSPA